MRRWSIVSLLMLHWGMVGLPLLNDEITLLLLLLLPVAADGPTTGRATASQADEGGSRLSL